VEGFEFLAKEHSTLKKLKIQKMKNSFKEKGLKNTYGFC